MTSIWILQNLNQGWVRLASGQYTTSALEETGDNDSQSLAMIGKSRTRSAERAFDSFGQY